MSDAVRSVALTQEIVDHARNAATRRKNVVLLGTYLFPFCQSIVLAADILRRSRTNVSAIIIPAGSDVWQIGACAKDVMRQIFGGEGLLGVTYSRRFADEIESIIGISDRFHIIPPPVDVARFHPIDPAQKEPIRRALGIPPKRLTLLACSNMRPVKGVLDTLAIGEAVSRNRQVTLLLVGPVTEHLRSSFEKLHIHLPTDFPCSVQRENLLIHLTGLREDTVPYHQASDIALNTSQHDSFNLSLAESMACGVPCVSSDIVGIGDIAERYGAGFLFPFKNNPLDNLDASTAASLSTTEVSGIAHKILALVNNETSYSEMAEGAVKASHEMYSYQVIKDAWAKLFFTQLESIMCR